MISEVQWRNGWKVINDDKLLEYSQLCKDGSLFSSRRYLCFLDMELLMAVFKKVLNRLKYSLKPKTTLYQGTILPAPDLRFGGKHFKDNKAFFDSACKEADRLVQHCGLGLQSRVLEIGAGPGRLPIGILHRVGEIAQYSDLDVHKRSVKWCNRYIHSYHPTFTFTHVDVANPRYNKSGEHEQSEIRLDFPDKTFDIIYLYSVFSHLTTDDVTAYLKEFQRLLNPEGKVFLTAFVEEDVENMAENPENYQGGWWEGPLHCVRYNRAFLESLFEEHGFVVDRYQYGKETDGQSVYYLCKAQN